MNTAYDQKLYECLKRSLCSEKFPKFQSYRFTKPKHAEVMNNKEETFIMLNNDKNAQVSDTTKA
jgi:hypothetical protein